MATKTTGLSHQGTAAERYSLLDSETVTVIFTGPVNWDGGGFSWVIQPESGASVAVQHALMLDSAGAPVDWTNDPNSPYTESREGNERFRISAIRFTTTGAGAEVYVLGMSALTTEFS